METMLVNSALDPRLTEMPAWPLSASVIDEPPTRLMNGENEEASSTKIPARPLFLATMEPPKEIVPWLMSTRPAYEL